MNDPISDMLTRIRNAAKARLPIVEMPHSKMKESIANILKDEGYINEVVVSGEKIKYLKLNIKYIGKRGVIEGLRRVSRPGLRCYTSSKSIPRVLGGLGTAIVSTSEGLMTGNQARKKNLGGEILCYVW